MNCTYLHSTYSLNSEASPYLISIRHSLSNACRNILIEVGEDTDSFPPRVKPSYNTILRYISFMLSYFLAAHCKGILIVAVKTEISLLFYVLLNRTALAFPLLEPLLGKLGTKLWMSLGRRNMWCGLHHLRTYVYSPASSKWFRIAACI